MGRNRQDRPSPADLEEKKNRLGSIRDSDRR